MTKIVNIFDKPLRQKDKTSSLIQEEIASTYFRTSNKKNAKKNFLISRIPWIITSVALALVFFMIIFKSDIDVKIQVLGEVPIVKTKGALENQIYELFDKGIFLVRGG